MKLLERMPRVQVTLMPEEAEDMWHTYNLLQIGDSLMASTIRYVRLVDNVRDNGGTSPPLSLPCTELTQLSGVAAILRFPIADLSEPEDDSSSDEE
uniref:Pelota mRNA surveillance and ribosome rescue factor n=1 Tax=Salmo trutta TaxID=8032 RepID=A0A674DTG7_SALTR